MSERPGPLAGYTLATLAAACWAANGLLANWLFAAGALDARVLAADRALVAFAILLAALALVRRRALPVRVREVPFLALFGVAGLAAVQYAYYRTIELTGQPAIAILLEYFSPVIVCTLSVALLRERLTWALPAGVVLSVAGCALVVGAPGPGRLAIPAEGLAWGLAAAGFFAAYTLLGRYAASRFDPWTVLVYGLGAASALWLTALGPGAVLEPLADPATAAAIVFSAVVGTIVPFGAYLSALRLVEATKVNVTAALEPVFVAAGAFVVFGHRLTAAQLAGGAAVVAAIVIVQRSGAAEGLPPGE